MTHMYSVKCTPKQICPWHIFVVSVKQGKVSGPTHLIEEAGQCMYCLASSVQFI